MRVCTDNIGNRRNKSFINTNANKIGYRILGCVFVNELFRVDLICVYGLLPPSFDGFMIPPKKKELNNTDCGLC